MTTLSVRPMQVSCESGVNWYRKLSAAPPNAVVAVAMAKIQVPILLGSTPTRRAPSGFSAAAVIAWAGQVRLGVSWGNAGGAGRGAEPGPWEAKRERRGEGGREQGGVQLRARYRHRAEGERLVEVGRGGGRRVRPPGKGDDGLGDEGDGERHDDRQAVVVPLHPLDDDTVDAGAERGERH